VALFSFNSRSPYLTPNQPASPAARFFFAYLFPWPFVLLGGAALYFGVKQWELADQSTVWPKVPGTVQSSQVVWSHNDDGSTASARVVYTYIVLGRQHTGDKVRFGDYSSSDTSHADSLVSQYSPGQKVDVFYDPFDYSKSVLQPGVYGGTYFVPALGAVFLVVGLFMLWGLPKAMASARNQTPVSNEPVGLRPPTL
jgi:hypothetical protein